MAKCVSCVFKEVCNMQVDDCERYKGCCLDCAYGLKAGRWVGCINPELDIWGLVPKDFYCKGWKPNDERLS